MHPNFRIIYTFLNKKWHFDQIVNELIAVKIMNFGYLTSFQTIDKGFIEQLGPTGFTMAIFNTSFNIVNFQSGLVFQSVYLFVYFFLIYFFIYFLITVGLFFLVYNIQFFLIIFGFFLLGLTNFN
jgi:hypothetical protein